MPYIVPFEADESVFAGESVQLNCHVSKGDLPVDIKWHFHGFENTDSSHLGILTTKMTSRTSFLSIAAAGAGHSGTYTCVANNHAGAANHSTVLNVHGTTHMARAETTYVMFIFMIFSSFHSFFNFTQSRRTFYHSTSTRRCSPVNPFR